MEVYSLDYALTSVFAQVGTDRLSMQALGLVTKSGYGRSKDPTRFCVTGSYRRRTNPGKVKFA